MVERICPACQHANSVQDHYCGKCGTALERQVLARRGETGLTIAGRTLPVTWRQVGRTAALGAAALAAEVGLAFLRRRLENPAPTTALAKPNTLLGKRPAGNGNSNAVTIVSQRKIEITHGPDGRVQINDHHVWQKREDY